MLDASVFKSASNLIEGTKLDLDHLPAGYEEEQIRSYDSVLASTESMEVEEMPTAQYDNPQEISGVAETRHNNLKAADVNNLRHVNFAAKNNHRQQNVALIMIKKVSKENVFSGFAGIGLLPILKVTSGQEEDNITPSSSTATPQINGDAMIGYIHDHQSLHIKKAQKNVRFMIMTNSSNEEGYRKTERKDTIEKKLKSLLKSSKKSPSHD